MTRMTGERVVKLGQLVQVSSVQFMCCEQRLTLKELHILCRLVRQKASVLSFLVVHGIGVGTLPTW